MITSATAADERSAAALDLRPGEELSFAEELLWRAEQEGAATSPFCPRSRSFVVRLKGPLEERALSAGLAAVVDRHRVLRSTFVADKGNPRRLTLDSWVPEIARIDRRRSAVRSPSEEARDIVENVVKPRLELPFDLALGPLLRAALVTLAGDERVLAIAIDHIVFDRWSRRLFEFEWKRAYEACLAGRAIEIPPLPASYRDYVAWQRRILASDRGKRFAEYWIRKLNGAADLALPSDRAPSPVASARSHTLWFSIPPEDAARLGALSRRCRATLATTMLALFQLFLYRASGVDDISVGVPLSDRRRPEFESLIGLFMNLVVVRTSIAPSLAFPEFLDRVRRALVDACLHQDLPYGYLVGILPQRPLYRAVFNFMPTLPSSDLEFAGVRAEIIHVPAEAESFADLSLHVRETAGAFLCRFVYRDDLFSESLAQSFVCRFQALVKAVLNEPQNAVRAYAMS